MPSAHRNRLLTAVSAVAGSGLGAFTIGSASSGYRTFVAGDDGLSFDVTISEGATWEVRTGCVYTHSGTSLARGTLADSSTGSAITFTAAAVVTQGGTAGFAANTALLLDVFGLTEISVTGTVTATIGRMHHCTGTSADYTVTLPAASGNAGRLIGFRMGSASGLTKLVTLDGNASETIDGSTTRVMWSGESAILLCDGSNWFKITGKTVPMACLMSRNAALSGLASGTDGRVDLDYTELDNTGLMGDTTNKRINIKRPANYQVMGVVQYYNGATTGRCQSRIKKNAGLTLVSSAEFWVGVAAAAPETPTTPVLNLVAGDYLYLYYYQTTGGNQDIYTTARTTQLAAVEIPAW